MSRYCSNEAVLSAAKVWRDKCLVEGKSMFFDEALWTSENVKNLDQHFVKNLIAGRDEGHFLPRLKKQLERCPKSAIKLCAEIIWLLYLSLNAESIGPRSKRETINAILGWADEKIPDNHPYDQNETLEGLGSAAFFTRYLWREIVYVINLLKQHYAESPAERTKKLASGEKFSTWLESIPDNEQRQFRHMILFLLFPDSHERLFGRQVRLKIAAAFSKQERSQLKKLKARELDERLREIRSEREKLHGKKELDWYEPPLLDVWQDKPTQHSKAEEPQPAPFPDSGSEEELPQTLTLSEACKDVFVPLEEIKNMLALLHAKKNIIIKGPPGVGKTFISKRLAYALMKTRDKSRIKMVQFHQSYSYEDFVQGYRPSGSGFELKNGTFYEFCMKAKNDPNREYVFIIDEINRGNLSKILGELMMLIEADKRKPEWAIPLTYNKEEFYVPENLYLIGLMNTADRSLALVDYALRRRFTFFDLKPEFKSEAFFQFMQDAGANATIIEKIISRLSRLNEEIESDTANLGPGFCIGHSFFCPQDANQTYDDRWFERIIRFEIKPLLEEYWFDEPETAKDCVGKLLSKIS